MEWELGTHPWGRHSDSFGVGAWSPSSPINGGMCDDSWMTLCLLEQLVEEISRELSIHRTRQMRVFALWLLLFLSFITSGTSYKYIYRDYGGVEIGCQDLRIDSPSYATTGLFVSRFSGSSYGWEGVWTQFNPYMWKLVYSISVMIR